MSKSKITFGGSEALLGAAFLFALTNVLVREMAMMWGDQAQVAVRFALVWIILVVFAHLKRTRTHILAQKNYQLCYTAYLQRQLFFFSRFQYK